MTYHGEVLDSGRDFAAIDTDGCLVVLKITFCGHTHEAVFDVAMTPEQAREIARHINAAADSLAQTSAK